MCLWTKSQMACTRAQPGLDLPNRLHARSRSWSLSQYRLAIRKARVSSGSFSTAISWASDATASARPLSRTTASVEIRTTPGGAKIRVQRLPKRSRYSEIGTDGLTTISSGLSRSRLRESWMRSIMITGVALGKSYSRSKPTLSFKAYL